MSVDCGNSWLLPTISYGGHPITDVHGWGVTLGGVVVPLLTDDVHFANSGPTIADSFDVMVQTYDLGNANLALASAGTVGSLLGGDGALSIVATRGSRNSANSSTTSVTYACSHATCLGRQDGGVYGVGSGTFHFSARGYQGARPTVSIVVA